ncbi:NAD(P)-binding protein [Serendipita vermifera]|nr:NAD(P)-binding protein [Serendipita vermifera]
MKAFPSPPAPEITKVFQPNLFKGKVLFCTGGGSGICKVITENMMRLGARAAIVGRTLERLQSSAKELSEKTGLECLPLQADVRKYADLEAAANKTVEKFGKIDYVICGAAGNFLAPISGLSPNAFRTVVEIDTLGTYNTIKATLPHVRSSRGSYVHISATLHHRGTPFQAHVSAAKAGVDALSKVLAVEEGPHGVRSNVIAPGPIGGTEGMDRLSRKTEDGSSIYGENYIPVQRMGSSLDIAHAAVYLFSDAASFVSGQVIVVDGASEDVRPLTLPYPEAVLDPEGAKKMIKARL